MDSLDDSYLLAFCARAEFQVFLHKAKKITKRELWRQTPDCIGAKLLITRIAFCANRNRHFGTPCGVVRHGSLLKIASIRLPPSVLISRDPTKLLRILFVSTIMHVMLRSPPSLGKDIALARCRNGQRAWRNKKPVLTFSADPDEEGHSKENEDESGRRHFPMIQRRRGITNKEILRYFQLVPDDINWTIDQAKVDGVLALKNDSAPGLDGILYGANRCAGGLGSEFLFRDCKAVL